VEVVHGQTTKADANVIPGTDASTMTPEQWANSQFSGTVTSATIDASGRPIISFTITNQNGVGVIGFANNKSQTTANIVPTYNNLSFAFAKLVPGDNTKTNVWESPSRWVSYIVTSMPAKCLTTTTGYVAGTGCAVTGYGNTPLNGTLPVTPAKPSTDNTGTLTDLGSGNYTYTFYRAITAASATVTGLAASAVAASAVNVVADLGDLSFQPTMTHRVGIHISGNARGTGTNNATGDATLNGPAVALKTPSNVFYDFVPGAVALVPGTTVAQNEPDSTKQRNLVDVKNCLTCHVKFTFHGGNALTGVGGARQDTRMCVLCHTDQRKYSVADTTINMAVKPPTITSGDRMRGFSMKNLPVWIHKIHNGENMVLQGYNASNVLLNETRFPQDIRNCTKCHSNATGSTNAPQAANYTVPSRLACGACHDGIDFATGLGVRLADKYTDELAGNPVGTTASNHGGGAYANDSTCVLCHGSGQTQDVAIVHTPVSPIDPTWTVAGHTNSSAIAGYNSTNLPVGALKISYDLKSVTLNASAKPVLTFRFMNGATAVVFNTQPASAPTATQVNANNVTELMSNFVGGPNAYVMAAVPQDGITPADFNSSSSVYVRNCWNKVLPTTTCTMTGPDGSGYYALTMTGVTMPASANMIYGGIGFNDGAGTTNMPLTQTNVAGYAILAANASSVPVTTTVAASGVTATNAADVVKGYKGGLNVPATPVTKLVSGTLPAGFAAQTARRSIVDKKLCDNCHNSLGTFTFASFHGAQRNDPDRCILCHDANRTNNGWNVSSNAHVHAIHSAAKRQADNGPNFTWTAKDATGGTTGAAADGFFNIGYPGILRNCQSCHLPNTVNFGATANAAQATNLAFRTVCSGATPMGGVAGATATTMSPYVVAGTVCGTGFSASLATGVITNAAGTTLVNSPITNACFSCHTTSTAKNHMVNNGGALYKSRNDVAGGTYTGTLAQPIVP
jgi:OmcA/MtrC family decaheme c-type cytochrome